HYDLEVIALEHNPMFVTIFIDVTINNYVIVLFHGYENQNREFIQAIKDPDYLTPSTF
ncbi:8510_t:CDS:1, partial [Racocetra fulgida]